MQNAIDQLLSSNTRLQVVVTMLVLAHGIAGYWAWRRGDVIPVLVLNAAVAATIWIYHGPRLAMSIASQDSVVLALLAFEALTFIGCVAALCGMAMPRGVVWLMFATNAVMSVAFMVFAFTFRITKLF